MHQDGSTAFQKPLLCHQRCWGRERRGACAGPHHLAEVLPGPHRLAFTAWPCLAHAAWPRSCLPHLEAHCPEPTARSHAHALETHTCIHGRALGVRACTRSPCAMLAHAPQAETHIQGAREEARKYEEERRKLQDSRNLAEQRKAIEKDKLQVQATAS